MSLRDYFAAQALPTVLSFMTQADVESHKDGAVKMVAETAYGVADAMLIARKR